jgi:hypothetical protein
MTEFCDKCGKVIDHWDFKSVRENGEIICKDCCLKDDEE